MRKIALTVIAGLFLVSFAVVAQKPEASISQGDFAILLASSLNRPAPNGGWTTSNAPAFLAGLDITPANGAWSPAATLKESDLAHILRLMGLNFYSTAPNDIVTWGRARSVIARFRDYFRSFNLPARSLDHNTTTHIYTGIGGTEAGAPAPASPSTP